MKKITTVLLCLVLILTGCGKIMGNTGSDEEMTGNHTKENITEVITETPVPDPVEVILQQMTLKEKIGQLFIIALDKDSQGNPMVGINEGIKEILKEYRPGGVIFFAENIETIPQTVSLIQALQAASTTPLFIAVDEEGGLVSRITKSEAMHATVFPNQAVIGKRGDPVLAGQVAAAIAAEIASLGFNMNFAPVADINTNPDNPVIGVRSYGNEPQGVGKMVAAAVNGIQSQPVSSVLKHFPGHGDTREDSHYGAATVYHTRERLFETELLPFIEGIDAGADAVMTAHILTPKIEGEDLPATLKSSVITDILRKDLGYDGLIITDAMNMGAVTKHFTSDEAAIKAIQVGVDIILMPQDLKTAFSGVFNACQSGEIAVGRLNESVRRILETKHRRGLLDAAADRGDPHEVLGCAEHIKLQQKLN